MGWFPSMFASTRCSWKVWWATHGHTRITWSANSLDIMEQILMIYIYIYIYILLQLIMCICIYAHMIHLHLHLHLQHPHHHHHHHHHRQININVASCVMKNQYLHSRDGLWKRMASLDRLRTIRFVGWHALDLMGWGTCRSRRVIQALKKMQVGQCGSSTLPSSWT